MYNIHIITYPINYSAYNILNKYINLINSDKCIIHLVSSKKIFHDNIENITYNNINIKKILYKIIYYLYIQLYLMRYIYKNRNNIEYIHFILAENAIIPITFSKILSIRSILIITNSYKLLKKQSIQFYISYLLELFCVYISDIVVSNIYYTKKNNIILPRHFIPIRSYDIIPIEKRSDIIAYIGRFEYEKGIINFIKAIDMIRFNDIKIIIIGDGSLRKEIINHVQNKDNIALYGWLGETELFDLLRDIKILIIPSLYEIGPWIALEAISYKVPIISTNTGIISDILVDGSNGFIIPDNYPNTIAKKINEVWDDKKLNIIYNNIDPDMSVYSFSNIKDKWLSFISDIYDKKNI